MGPVSFMRYQFLVDTYETEILKVASAWSMFEDADLPARPHATDKRGRSVREHMVHQSISEDTWMRSMLGIQSSRPALPPEEDRLSFIRHYGDVSSERLEALRAKPPEWWQDPVAFFDVTRARAWVFL